MVSIIAAVFFLTVTTGILEDIDPRGPILDHVARVGKQAVQAVDAPRRVSPDDRGPGVGRWIWLRGAGKAAPVRFRKEISLAGVPRSIRGWITADVRYRLWVNGHLAARGPADVGRDYDSGPCGPWLEDVRDLTRLFKKGPNILAVEVFPTPLVQSEGTFGQPGLKMDLLMACPALPIVKAGTDESWRASPASDLSQEGAKNGFRIDMNLEPVGWKSLDYDDSKWPRAMEAENSRRPTLISELSPPLEAIIPAVGFTRISPGVSPIPATSGAKILNDGGYSVRFGHVLAGYVGLKVFGHFGARLLITPNEHDAAGFNRESEIVLREGIQTVELPYFDSFSVINIQAVGVTAPIEIEDVRCVFSSYPVRYSGDFSCDRADFNRVWEVCRFVTQICMQTHHLDSPHHQEPICDPGDYLIESLVSFYAFGEGTLARQDLKKFGRLLEQRKYQTFHTSYELLWLQMLMQYYDFTGDAAPLRELAPTVFGLLDRFQSYVGSHGLISEAPNYMFMDWVEIEGFNLHHPPAVIGQGYMSALYYRALADGIRIAELIGDNERVERFSGQRLKVGAAFERELWDPEQGLYRDGKPFQSSIAPNQWLPADKSIETFSTQVNTLAVACGLVASERAAVVMKKVLARSDMNCQPYFMHFVFEALSRAGVFDKFAESQMERWQIVPDTQSFHEMWNSGDLSHAWNATPLIQMSARILGVTPVKPGFAKFKIDPHPCGLRWAKGRVPSPHGLISVSWSRTPAGVQVRFVAPPGTVAEVDGKQYGAGAHRVEISSVSVKS